MMYLRYLLSAIFVLIVMIIQFVFGWYIALFVKADGTYPWFLKWAQPFDTLAIGDQMFWDNEMAHTKDWHWWVRNYWLALNWSCWRNPGYGAMGYLGFKAADVTGATSTGTEIDIGDNGYTLGTVYRTVISSGIKYFDYKRAGRWSDNYGWMVQFGWSLNFSSYTRGDIRRLCLDIRPRIKLEQK